jgi:hypothetical protein
MNLKVQTVDVNHISQVWPLIETYLNDALTKDNEAPEWSTVLQHSSCTRLL